METIVKSDLFFFVTGISVILITFFWLIIIAIVSYFGYKILKNLRAISSIVKDQTEKISSDADRMRKTVIDDMDEARKEAKTSILVFFKLFNIVLNKITESKKSRGKNKKKK